jgi:hypothetical protein
MAWPSEAPANISPLARPRSSSLSELTASASMATSCIAAKVLCTISTAVNSGSPRGSGTATSDSSVPAISSWVSRIQARRWPKRRERKTSTTGPEGPLEGPGQVEGGDEGTDGFRPHAHAAQLRGHRGGRKAERDALGDVQQEERRKAAATGGEQVRQQHGRGLSGAPSGRAARVCPRRVLRRSARRGAGHDRPANAPLPPPLAAPMHPPELEALQIRLEGAVAIVSLNRPDKAQRDGLGHVAVELRRAMQWADARTHGARRAAARRRGAQLHRGHRPGNMFMAGLQQPDCRPLRGAHARKPARA